MQRFRQFQIFFNGRNFIVETTTFLFEFLQSILVGADTLIKADQYIGELFQRRDPARSMLALYACLQKKSIHNGKQMACFGDVRRRSASDRRKEASPPW